MQLEITETTPAVTQRMANFNVRWGAIWAGLAVGLATNMVLVLVGAAAGLSFFNVGSSNAALPMSASIWNTVSMVISAFIGGYIAARSCGMKRSTDGVLHAVVAWGMTLLVAVFLATSVTGNTFNAMFPSLHGKAVQETTMIMDSIDQGDRQAAVDAMQRNLGVSNTQAQTLVDQALAVSGRNTEIGAGARSAAEDTVRTAAIVSVWLAASTVMSLLMALAGGLTGIRGSRRILHQRTTRVA